MDDQERAAFEKWADLSSRQGMRHKDGTYMYARIQDKWEGWQARAALAAAAPVAAPDEVKGLAHGQALLEWNRAQGADAPIQIGREYDVARMARQLLR